MVQKCQQAPITRLSPILKDFLTWLKYYSPMSLSCYQCLLFIEATWKRFKARPQRSLILCLSALPRHQQKGTLEAPLCSPSSPCNLFPGSFFGLSSVQENFEITALVPQIFGEERKLILNLQDSTGQTPSYVRHSVKHLFMSGLSAWRILQTRLQSYELCRPRERRISSHLSLQTE